MLFVSRVVGYQNGTILVTVLSSLLVTQMLVPSNATPVAPFCAVLTDASRLRNLRRVRTGWTRQRWWRLLEPSADQVDIERTLDAVLASANGAAVTQAVAYDGPLVAALLNRHRVASSLAADDVFPAGREQLRARQREVAAGQLRLCHAAAETLAAFTAVGIEARVLKGLATAELDHIAPDRRHSGDVDLALAPGDLDHAVALLRQQGCVELPTPFDPVLWYGKAFVRPDGVEVDLHTRLFRRSPLGRSLLDEPGVPLARVPGVALAAHQRLVHAAGHFLISPPGSRRMSGFIDIGRIVARPGLDLDEARAFAAELHVESLVGAGIRVEAELSMRPEVLEHLRVWKQPDWFERQTRLVSHRRMVLDHVGRYREVPVGRRLEYLPAWFLPSRRQQRLLVKSVRAWVSRVKARMRPSGVGS